MKKKWLTFFLVSSLDNMDLQEIIPAGDSVTVTSPGYRVKLLPGPPVRSMLAFVFTWSPRWY